MRTSTIPTMSGYEEDFGHFPSEYNKESKESLVGAYRAESTSQYTAGSGRTLRVGSRGRILDLPFRENFDVLGCRFHRDG